MHVTVIQNARPAEATGIVDVQVMGLNGVVSKTRIAPTARGVTVDELLSRKNGFMIAHRGGSDDWPDMSLLAYNESVNRGIPALEFSFSLTSDGVPVGVHNQNLKGVDRSAPETPVTQMTWEQVRQYKTEGQPFIRLQDLTAAYGSDHVLFVDPKYSAQPVKTYLDWLDPQHTILKFQADATHLADAWRAAGFKTWGFFYKESDALNSKAREQAGHWDLIGVDWEAKESTWETAKGYGRPIIGHICPSQEAINKCLRLGAVGVMCSKIDGMTLP
jgi:hypothetical protein